MKKLLVLGVGAVSAGAVALSLFGAGIASADDQVVGQTFKDAKAALSPNRQGGGRGDTGRASQTHDPTRGP